MSQKLTEKQQNVYNFIKDFMMEKGYSPTVREIGDGLGFSSPATIFNYLKRLEKKGYIKHDATKPRAIELLDDDIHFERVNVINVPYIKYFKDGEPLLTEANISEYVPLPERLASRNSFMFQFSGFQMVDAGIYDGDTLIAENTSDVSIGDLILVSVEGNLFTRRLVKRTKGTITIRSENEYALETTTKNFEIYGKITGIYRNLQ